MTEFDQSQEYIQKIQFAIEKATEIVAGPGTDPFAVFPNPADKERRADVEWDPMLSEAEEEAFRGVMSELGIGRERSIGPGEAGLSNDNYVAVFEGGQPHKLIAQLNIVDNPDEPRPGQYIVTGATGRILGQAEKENAANLLGIDIEQVGETEYDLAVATVSARNGFEPAAHRTTAENNGDQWHSEETLGTLNGALVKALAIKRVEDPGDRSPQWTNQEKMEKVVRDVKASYRGLPIKVAFVTSSTYQPSNEIEAAAASLNTDGDVRVLSYGTHELAAVKGVDPVVPAINQLGGEAYKTAAKLAAFQQNQ